MYAMYYSLNKYAILLGENVAHVATTSFFLGARIGGQTRFISSLSVFNISRVKANKRTARTEERNKFHGRLVYPCRFYVQIVQRNISLVRMNKIQASLQKI